MRGAGKEAEAAVPPTRTVLCPVYQHNRLPAWYVTDDLLNPSGEMILLTICRSAMGPIEARANKVKERPTKEDESRIVRDLRKLEIID
jgi:hypothetical protein